MGVTVLGIQHKVALRKESVDRNFVGCIDRTIDIIVALRKESVDRNDPDGIMVFCGPRRSPQGERG